MRDFRPSSVPTTADQQPKQGPSAPPSAPRIIVGLDLGEVKDFTALTCFEQTKQMDDKGREHRHYACRFLYRWPLHTAYEHIIENVRAIATKLPAAPELVLDATGAGRPVAQWIRRANLPVKSFVPVIITGGVQVLQDDEGYWHVAKRELVSCVQSALQAGRLKISNKLKEAKTLTKELQRFRSKININTGNESFEAWRAKDHDDMVLATALGIWYGEKNFDIWAERIEIQEPEIGRWQRRGWFGYGQR